MTLNALNRRTQKSPPRHPPTHTTTNSMSAAAPFPRRELVSTTASSSSNTKVSTSTYANMLCTTLSLCACCSNLRPWLISPSRARSYQIVQSWVLQEGVGDATWIVVWCFMSRRLLPLPFHMTPPCKIHHRCINGGRRCCKHWVAFLCGVVANAANEGWWCCKGR